MVLPEMTPLQQGAVLLLVWAAGGLLAGQLAYWLWDRVFLRLARKTKTDADETVLVATRGPVRAVIILSALYAGSRMSVAGVPEVAAHPAWAIWEGALYVGLVLAGTVLAYAATSALARLFSGKVAAGAAGSLSEQFLAVFCKVAKVVFLFVAVTIIFSHFDIQITGLLATAGVASLAVALAAQETLANMIAGFVLLVDRPFKAGDRVELANGQVGDVIEVGLRSTRVLSFDNTVITIPNSEVAKSQVINLNAPDAQVKIRCTLGVAYGSDLRRAKAILMDVMTRHAEVLKAPPPAVYFTEFGESSLNLLFICWVADYREKFRIQDELNMAIKDRFEAAGINVPFPQREVHVRVADLAAFQRAPSPLPGGAPHASPPTAG